MITMPSFKVLQPYTLYPLVAAVIVKLALAASKLRIAKRIASTALEADGWHDITDLFSTTVAIVAVAFTLANPERFGVADHVGGITIGFVIFFLSVRVVRRTVEQLLDTMPDADKMRQIREIALSVPGTLGIEKEVAGESVGENGWSRSDGLAYSAFASFVR